MRIWDILWEGPLVGLECTFRVREWNSNIGCSCLSGLVVVDVALVT